VRGACLSLAFFSSCLISVPADSTVKASASASAAAAVSPEEPSPSVALECKPSLPPCALPARTSSPVVLPSPEARTVSPHGNNHEQAPAAEAGNPETPAGHAPLPATAAAASEMWADPARGTALGAAIPVTAESECTVG